MSAKNHGTTLDLSIQERIVAIKSDALKAENHETTRDPSIRERIVAIKSDALQGCACFCACVRSCVRTSDYIVETLDVSES